MALENRLEIRLAQKLILTPQLQQAIKLLQMPYLELSEFLNQELVENPFLEEAVDDLPTEQLIQEEKEFVEDEDIREDAEVPLEGFMNFTVDEYFEEREAEGKDVGYFNPGTVTPPSFEQFLTKAPDLYDHLLWQLRLSNEPAEIRKIGEIIIGNIDENGYLRASLEEIIEKVNIQRETAEKALHLIQSFDPPGVGARDVKECLLLQLGPLNLRGTIVEKIITNNMDDLEKKRYSPIARQYNLALKDVMAAVKVIEGLEPKPCRNFSSASVVYIAPDVYVVKIEDGYQIILNDDELPKLKLNSFYKKLIQQNNASKEDKQFLLERLRSAEGLLKSLDQRNKTIYRVTESLLGFQREFFDKGIKYIKPLTLKDVASELNMHESTISRVTSRKYLSCNNGIFNFRVLFSNALPGETGNISSTSVKELIKKIVAEENSQKPFSDQYISDMLKKNGITIARRTIAKYREELGIPAQMHRRKIG
ncbi:MAG: RNA polymerase factor sigma-54 [Nitrospirota bacterium]